MGLVYKCWVWYIPQDDHLWFGERMYKPTHPGSSPHGCDIGFLFLLSGLNLQLYFRKWKRWVTYAILKITISTGLQDSVRCDMLSLGDCAFCCCMNQLPKWLRTEMRTWWYAGCHRWRRQVVLLFLWTLNFVLFILNVHPSLSRINSCFTALGARIRFWIHLITFNSIP